MLQVVSFCSSCEKKVSWWPLQGSLSCCLLLFGNLSWSLTSVIQFITWVKSNKLLPWWLFIIRYSSNSGASMGCVFIAVAGPFLYLVCEGIFLIFWVLCSLSLLWYKWVLLPPGLAGTSSLCDAVLLVLCFSCIWLSSRISQFMFYLSCLFFFTQTIYLIFLLWFSCLSLKYNSHLSPPPCVLWWQLVYFICFLQGFIWAVCHHTKGTPIIDLSFSSKVRNHIRIYLSQYSWTCLS